MPNTNTREYHLLENAVRKTFRSIRSDFNGTAAENSLYEGIEEDLLHFIVSGNDPEYHYGECIGTGAFKECYELTDHFIIKFASACNRTDLEEHIINAALDEDVKGFIPSYFIPLFGYKVPLYLIDGDDQYYEVRHSHTNFNTYSLHRRAEDPFATYAVIQPRIKCTVDRSDYQECLMAWRCPAYVDDVQPRYEGDELPAPLTNPDTGEIIPKEIVFSLNISDRFWLEEYMRYYGAEALAELAAFIEKYSICDLHNANLGYIIDDSGDLQPIILDWISGD